MDNNVLEIIDLYAREHNLNKDELMSILEDTLKKTWEQEYGTGYNLEIKITKNDMIIQRILDVVPEVQNLKTEVQGDIPGKKIESHNFFSSSEKSIQFFKKEFAESIEAYRRQKQYDLFKDKEGEIISGVVSHKDDRIHVRIFGTHKAIIPKDFMVKTEVFRPKDKILALVHEVKLSEHGHQIILDRKSNAFISKLMAFYIAEIAKGMVQIKHIVRRPGLVSKIVVDSSAENDCIGACVGVKGQKIKPIIAELQREKIDLIRWSDNHSEFIKNCLKDIEVKHIEFGNPTIIVVRDEQMGKAIHLNASATNATRYENRTVNKLIDSVIGSPVKFVSLTEYTEKTHHNIEQTAKSISDKYGQTEEIKRILETYGEVWNIPITIQKEYQGIQEYIQAKKFERKEIFLIYKGSEKVFDIVSDFNNKNFDIVVKNFLINEEKIKSFESSNEMSQETGLDINTCVLLMNSL
jgi:N utilization substance protein A